MAKDATWDDYGPHRNVAYASGTSNATVSR